jgi:tRNA U34 2-thiouridine synthase MnmA/TrmU
MSKAIGLISGGLDSLLAARVLLDQGIELLGLSFETPFFGPGTAKRIAVQLGIPLRVMEISEEHLKIVMNPPHGYGSAMNPCIDCHALMIRKAGQIMEEEGYDFIFTGEVLNQRPMSQNRQSLQLVAKLSGYSEFLLRPLSAKLLPETRVEREGIVDRQGMFDMQGRSRKRQLALARARNLAEFGAPAGGCLLTERGFSVKLRELFEMGNFDLRDVKLLKLGRHFRIGSVKMVLGRNEEENQKIKEMRRDGDVLLSAEHFPGPVALVCGGAGEEVLRQGAGICAAFSDVQGSEEMPELLLEGKYEARIRPPLLSRAQIREFAIGGE